jgi:hypothetical protein
MRRGHRHHAVHHVRRFKPAVHKKKHKRVKHIKHKNPRYQTGSSITKIDRRYHARKPGKRKAADGTRYYEHRRNRSDVHPREGL